MTRPPGKSPNQDIFTPVLENVSDQFSVTSEGLGDRPGDKKEMVIFVQILADQNQNRNILEIILRKLSNMAVTSLALKIVVY